MCGATAYNGGMRRPFPTLRRLAALAASLVWLACGAAVLPVVVVARRPPAQAVAAQPAAAFAPARVDRQRLMRDVRDLSAPELEGRLTGSGGSRRARAIILARFKQLKLTPLGGSYERRFSFTSTREALKREFPEATNLIGTIRGTVAPDDFILVTAHYDHLGIRDGQTYHGADDNASGVAAMLAVADWFASHPPRKTLVFVAFDAEEQGLQGARHFVAHPPIDLTRVAVVVNLDMLSRGDKNVLYAAGTHQNPGFKAPVTESARGRSIIVAFGHDRPGVQGMDDWTQSSDHGPFHAAGVPFLYFGVEDHPDYHKPTDTADKIPAAFYQEAAEVVLDVMRRLLES